MQAKPMQHLRATEVNSPSLINQLWTNWSALCDRIREFKYHSLFHLSFLPSFPPSIFLSFHSFFLLVNEILM